MALTRLTCTSLTCILLTNPNQSASATVPYILGSADALFSDSSEPYEAKCPHVIDMDVMDAIINATVACMQLVTFYCFER